MCITRCVVFTIILLLRCDTSVGYVLHGAAPFITPFGTGSTSRLSRPATATHLSVAKTSMSDQNNQMNEYGEREDDGHDEDAILLEAVSLEQLEDLCRQLNLNTFGSKQELLQRLRHYANQQVERESQNLRERTRRVENGSHDSKERYEIVTTTSTTTTATSRGDTTEEEGDDEDDEAYFYFELPKSKEISGPNDNHSTPKRRTSTITNTVITAPPPPDTPNENGERFVTIYSTADNNDLTGVAAAQPGQTSYGSDSLMGAHSSPGGQPWDMQNNRKSQATSAELDEATERITELVRVLLATTGAPAFASLHDEDLKKYVPIYPSRNDGFVGFDPSRIPTKMLSLSSKALRMKRGQILDDVVRQYELQAIGQDGMAGDNKEKGGGHYREVAKVRAFLDGYRRAEVRRLARATATMLLDRLVSEGVEGLDIALASMARSDDDTSDFAGELNDSLVDYLNDAIRQQEKKIENLSSQRLKTTGSAAEPLVEGSDALDNLWDATVDEEGRYTETIDPSNPIVKATLQEEFEKSKIVSCGPTVAPQTAAEQLLLLLSLLRERLKAEAVFGPDEKGRNLRLLAYCLKERSEKEQDQLIQREIGNSFDVSCCMM